MPNGPRRDRINPGVPPEFGTTPIPEGTVRFNHQTWGRSVPGIEAEGLKRSYSEDVFSRGGSEAPQVFATAGKPDYFPNQGDKHIVEGYAHLKQLDIGAPMGRSHMSQDQLGKHISDLEQHQSVITFHGDVPKEQLLAVHTPEHQAIREVVKHTGSEAGIMAGDYDYPGDNTFDTSKMALAAKVMVGGKLTGKSFKDRGI